MKIKYDQKIKNLDICAGELAKYYQDKGLLLVGLNDSQGLNINSNFLKKDLLDNLASLLTTNEFKPDVINAFSLLINKTEHINYLLKANVSIEEIKLAQLYGAVSAFEKVARDLKVPTNLSRLANVYKLVYKVKENDKNIHITTALQNANEPTIIYSSGTNNLMREIDSDPFSIKKQYKLKDIYPNYYYIQSKAKDPKILTKVFDGIRSNFDNLLAINSKSDIYTLGAYIPKSLEKEDMQIFRDLIYKYNETLNEICKSYQINYIDTNQVASDHIYKENNFHIDSYGHKTLANYILLRMYQQKILFKKPIRNIKENQFIIDNKQAEGVLESIKLDEFESRIKSFKMGGYEKAHQIKIEKEHAQERQVFEKVLKKTNLTKV